jgi:hypothetical protein
MTRKVLLPPMAPRVEQLSYLVCFGIDARQIWPLFQIAVDASESEIVHSIETTMLLGNDVLDMECRKR